MMTAALQNILTQLTPDEQKQVEEFARKLSKEHKAQERFVDLSTWSGALKDHPDANRSGIEMQKQIKEEWADSAIDGVSDVPR